jgi:general stress protein 26
MSPIHLDDKDLEKRLWSEIDKARFGMLGLAGGRGPLQPMTAFSDRERGAVWFFTRKSTDLARQTGDGHFANFCIMAKDQEFQACIGGELVPDHDPAKLHAFWNPIVSAWFPEGRSDPELTLLKLVPVDGHVWLLREGPRRYVFKAPRTDLFSGDERMGEARRVGPSTMI